MRLSLTSNKVYKFAYIYFIILFAIMTYIYISKDDIKTKFQNSMVLDLKHHYKIYKKVFKSSDNTRSILIENDNFVDRSEMIEQFTKSTPFIIKKEEKKVNKYDITFAFFDKDTKTPKNIDRLIDRLDKREYITEISTDQISLFGKVYDKGYIYITQYIDDERQIDSSIDMLFIELSLFALINIVIFIYFINLLKNNRSVASRMISEFEQLKEDTKKVAFEDTLTKAATRLKFDETLKDLIQIASRFEQNKFGVIMFDIDNFKYINDTHGHDYGDFVLKSVANAVKNSIRGSDTFARWGGEEFVVLSPMNDLEQTHKLAEKLRIEIESMELPKCEKVTSSFGAVVYEDEKSGDEIMKRADKLLYKAKKNGKNRVEI